MHKIAEYKEIQGIMLRLKKQEIISATLQDIMNAMDSGKLPQISGAQTLPVRRGHQMTTDQMKRLLALIENNA